MSGGIKSKRAPNANIKQHNQLNSDTQTQSNSQSEQCRKVEV